MNVESRKKRFAMLCGVFVFLWTASVHQQRYANPTAIPRQDFLHSIIVHHRWDIDRYHENTQDKAFARGHYYSDKAPGTAAVLFLPYWAGVHLFSNLGMDLEKATTWRYLSWFSAAMAFAPLLGFSAFRAIRALQSRYRSGDAWVVIGGMLMGGMPVVYSAVLFSHGLVLAALLLAFCYLGLLCKQEAASNRDICLSGLLAGLALASEYTVGLTVCALALYALSRWGFKRGLWFAAGMAVPCMLIPLYSYFTIGSLVELPYSYQASFPQMKEGLYGIKAPSLSLAWILLFSPERGLFYWSPFLLLGWVALAYPSGISRRLWILAAGIFVINVTVFSGRKFDWLAGISYGPRYLTAALPAFFLLIPPCVERLRRTAITLAVLSVSLTGYALLTQPVQYGDPNPIAWTMWRAILNSQVASTLAGLWCGNPLWGASIHYTALLLGFAGLAWTGYRWDGQEIRSTIEPGERDAKPKPQSSPVATGVPQAASGFTLTELLVVVAVIGVLISILLPGLSAVRRKVDCIVCLNNLRQIGWSFLSYADDHRMRLPRMSIQDGTHKISGPLPWDVPRQTLDALQPYGADRPVLYCPTLKERRLCDGAWDYDPDYRVIGYVITLHGAPHLYRHGLPERTDTLRVPRRLENDAERARRVRMARTSAVKNSMPVMAADVVISIGDNEVDRQRNRYWGVPGGYRCRGKTVLHGTAHLKTPSGIPRFANLLFIDGHANAREFERMHVRSPGPTVFWW